MAQVSLKGMKFYGFHGYYDFERRIGSEFILDVEVKLPIESNPRDQIEMTLDYEHIYAVSKKFMMKKYRLLESIAYDIGAELKLSYPIIEQVKVTLAKISPPVGGKVKRAEVAIIL